MKKIVALTLLASFVLPLSGFAQKGILIRDVRDVGEMRAKTTFGDIDAITDGTGVLVRWSTIAERSNIGFNLIRIDRPEKPVNKRMILGQATRARDEAAGGEQYQTFDPEGIIGVGYVVEGIDRSGRKSISQPAFAKYVANLDAAAGLETEAVRNAAVSDNGVIEKVSLAAAGKTSNKKLFAPEADMAVHRWVVSQPGVKISVNKDGFYKVTCGQLFDAEFNQFHRPTNWKLFHEGVEQAINVGSGDRCLEFYGRGRDEPESDTRVYYLIAGNSPGRRITSRSLTNIPTKQYAANYSAVAEKKERFSYVSKVINGDLDNYWGSIIFGNPSTLTFQVTKIDFTAPSTQMTVNMHGFPSADPYFPHLVRVKLNGNDLGNISGIGATPFSGVYPVPTASLVEGTNTLELASLNPGNDINMFDSVLVNYGRKYEAEQNTMRFSVPGGKRVNLNGFTQPNVRVFDLTAGRDPVLVTGLPIEASGSNFIVRLRGTNAFSGLAVDSTAVMLPDAVTQNKPSTLSTSANNGELIVISYSHPDFILKSEQWADYRRGQGFTAKVVSIEDVYDEFSYGSTSARAINSFLQYAADNWDTPPEYVLLMGDATVDPRNFQGFGNFNFVPTRMVPLVYAESGSDEALADFNNDGLAEMSIGRIPVRTSGSILTALAKTQLFETPANQALSRGAMFAFDYPDGWNFQLTSERIREELPTSMPVTFVGRGMVPPNGDPFTPNPNAQTELLAAMNSGKHTINYAGHGSSGLWASPTFFGNQNASGLTNANPTVFTMLTCLNGYFLRPDPVDSISEVLLKNPNGGAAAAWASTADTTPDIQTDMGIRFYEQLAAGDITRLGDLIRDAKTVIPAGADVRLSWALIGDPMLKVR